MNSKFLNITLILTLATAFAAAGCGTTATTETAKNSNVAAIVTNNSTAADEHAPVTNDASKAFRIDFKTEPAAVNAGTPAVLSFTVKDKQNATIKDLQIVHEKPMHLLIVSKDLAEFYHIHPEQSADGSYKVTHSFPNGGEYKLYADFTPHESKQIVEQIDLRVAGAERAKVALERDAKFEKTVDSLRVVMKPDGDLRSGQALMLNFKMFDAKTGKPATDLQNYLGELAHFVIISEDMKDFVHAHPMSADEHATGGGHHDDSGSKPHSHAAKTAARSASEVAAHVAFPRAGLYKIWAQFQRGGRVIDVPFVVQVAQGQQTAAKAANVPAGAIKITVSGEGYEPASVNVKKGEKLKLAFYRADAENCGGEVVFPKLNIRKKLPVGETVVVEVTPQESGELAFTCGMGMYKGKLLVAAN